MGTLKTRKAYLLPQRVGIVYKKVQINSNFYESKFAFKKKNKCNFSTPNNE